MSPVLTVIGFAIIIGNLGCMYRLGDHPRGCSVQAKAVTDRDVSKALLAEVLDLDFRSTALCDVIAFLQQKTGLNFVIEWRALDSWGVTQNTPISLQMHEVTLEQALDQLVVITDGGGAGGKINVEYSVDDGAVVITTSEASWRRAQTRVYDVRDLLFPDGKEPADADKRDDRIDELYNLVINTVQPEAWMENGGRASIDYFDGKAVVHAPPRIHRKLEWFFSELRRVSARPPTE